MVSPQAARTVCCERMHPLRPALEGLIDYAGLFPPAALPLEQALVDVERYARTPERWVLGRFILPLEQLAGVQAWLEASPSAARTWGLSLLADAADPVERTIEIVSHFAERLQPLGVRIEALEFGGADADAVARVGRLVPAWFDRFIEVRPGAAGLRLLDPIRAAGCFAKVRTGGVTADRFPTASDLATFIAACAERSLPFKATAGLHHPLRGRYTLTDQPGGPSAVMHGFVNLVLAAALLFTGRGAVEDAEILLEGDDPRQFSFRDSRLCWGGRAFTSDDLSAARKGLLRSVGSCSFEEPVSEVRRVFSFDAATS
jgi:hypothetical protein